jgi:hypothetical protein
VSRDVISEFADDKQSEASPAVIALIAQGSADSISQKEKPKLSKNDKQCLQTILVTIKNQLAASDDDEPAKSGIVESEIENAPVHGPEHEPEPEPIQHEPQQELQQEPTPSEPEPEPEPQPQQKLEPEPEPVEVESAPLKDFKDATCAPFFLAKEPPQEAVVGVDDDTEMLLE